MMGLEGTDFSPEDVIGDDLQRLDAQIASFQRRIDGRLEGGLDTAWVPCARGGVQHGLDTLQTVFSRVDRKTPFLEIARC